MDEEENNVRRRVSLSLIQKKAVLDYLDQNKPVVWISQVTGIPRSTVSNIKYKKKELVEAIRRGVSTSSKRNRGALHADLDPILVIWLRQQKVLGKGITSEVLMKKAKYFHGKMCHNPNCVLKFSPTWLTRFKARNGIENSALMDVETAVKDAAEEMFRESVANKIASLNLTLDQVYCADEIFMYWRKLPSETLIAIDEKTIRDKISVIACSNVTGSNRIPLQIVSRQQAPLSYLKPWTFSDEIYCTKTKKRWRSNGLLKDWFEDIFVPAVRAFNANQNFESSRVLLLVNGVDNAAELIKTDEFDVLVIPSSIAKICQPMNMPNITMPMRTQYRRFLLEKLISSEENWIEAVMTMELKDVRGLIEKSWNNLDQQAIFIAWDRILTGFDLYELNISEFRIESNLPSEAELISGYMQQLDEFVSKQKVLEWITQADDAKTEILTDEEIILLAEELNERGFTEPDEEQQPDPLPSPPSAKRAKRERNSTKVEVEEEEEESDIVFIKPEMEEVVIEEDEEDEEEEQEEENEKDDDVPEPENEEQEIVVVQPKRSARKRKVVAQPEPLVDTLNGSEEENDTEEHKVLESLNILKKYFQKTGNQKKLQTIKKWKIDFLNEIQSD